MLALVFLAGAVLRAEDIGTHLSDAEGYSYLVASSPGAGVFLHRLAAYENTPPLFYLLLSAFPLNGAGWLRVPAAVPGALIPVVTYVAIRRPLGARAALLAAGIVAVAPYHVSYSDYARGFMLAGLGCMLALWAMLRLLDGDSKRWWLLYVGGGALAMYSEYYSAIFLAGLVLAALVVKPSEAARTVPLGALPILSMAPWIHEIVRGQNTLNHTKSSPVFPGPSISTLRNVVVRLTLGEHGAGSSTGIHWVELVAILAVFAAAAVLLRRALATEREGPFTRAVLVAAITAAVVLIGHAIAHLVGIDIFNERYLTGVIPLAAVLLSATVASRRSARLWAISAAAVALVGVGVFVQRLGREYQPGLGTVERVAASLHPRELLTNSGVVMFYLRDLHPVLDRPFGLGPGIESSCRRPCVVVDDALVPGGVRRGPGPTTAIGPFVVRLATDAAG
jgi:uncharacterized membrane protein